MITIIDRSADIDFYVFAINTEDELAKLPTTTKAGTGELNTIKKASSGSFCFIANAELPCYVLNGDSDEWILTD